MLAAARPCGRVHRRVAYTASNTQGGVAHALSSSSWYTMPLSRPSRMSFSATFRWALPPERVGPCAR